MPPYPIGIVLIGRGKSQDLGIRNGFKKTHPGGDRCDELTAGSAGRKLLRHQARQTIFSQLRAALRYKFVSGTVRLTKPGENRKRMPAIVAGMTTSTTRRDKIRAEPGSCGTIGEELIIP